MFATMQGFLTFFILTLALIIIGIIFEEKLVWLENTIWRFINAVVAGVKMTIKERSNVHD